MKFHSLLKGRISSWRDLERKIEALTTAKERGDVFEEFAFAYFSLYKTLYQAEEVYMEKNIPPKYRERYSLEEKDCGVDGTLIHKDGTATAYQVKFRSAREKPSYAELSKFWAEARNFDNHLTVANSYELSDLCQKNPKHQSLLVGRFDDLGGGFFEELFEFVQQKPIIKRFFEPRPYQSKMISKVVEGFQHSKRGKLIAACGTGKTFTALRICEEIGAKKILFLAPSLALIKQALESWAEQSRIDFDYLCVCSDPTVSEEVDAGDLSAYDLSVPVTTSCEKISDFLNRETSGKKIIFSTYQSLDVLSKAMQYAEDFWFDITIFDEAHRTAGVKQAKLFSLALYDDDIRSDKRLFMTATERLLKPLVKRKALEYDRVVFSMDDEHLYGQVFDRFNFGEAINEGVISDYKIVVAGVRESEIYKLIKANQLLVETEDGSKEHHSTAQNVFRQLMLAKSIRVLPIRKVITFHSNISRAKSFIFGSSGEDISLERIIVQVLDKIDFKDSFLGHVNGSMSAGKRKYMLDLFKESEVGVVSNSRCLTEGVDVPLIDSVYFADPKRSLIDIVQACGRALRKPAGKEEKTAFFLIPILIPECEDVGEIINEIDFETLHNLIQSLRDQDERLASWIDGINLKASQRKTGICPDVEETPLILMIPTEIDIGEFGDGLYLRIADVNREPTRYELITRKYGRKERRSDYKRIFRTLGDYGVDSYRDNLVFPTLEKFQNQDSLLTIGEMKINHNNVSHTRRMGLIEKRGKKEYGLTPLGIQLCNSEIGFEDAFRRQMLRYCEVVKEGEVDRRMFPYRAFLKVLLEVKHISFIEFVFSLYLIIDSSQASIEDARLGAEYVRGKYPDVKILNEKNRRRVLEELNEYFETNFTYRDLWVRNTTVYNQFIYFRDHLCLFEGIVYDEKGKVLHIVSGSEDRIRGFLAMDEDLERITVQEEWRKRYSSEAHSSFKTSS